MDLSKTISFAITACNEYNELRNLLKVLLRNLRGIDEIVILLDEISYTNEVKQLVDSQPNTVKSFKYPLNKNFGNFKNQLNSHCTKDYIFQIDADEVISKQLIYNIVKVINSNNIDLYYLPRLNTIWPLQDIFEYADLMNWNVSYHPNYYRKVPKIEYENIYEHLDKRGFVISENDSSFYHYIPIINYPDYQGRIYKNNKHIKWVGKVHEVIKGHENHFYFPKNKLNYCIYHPKTIHKQKKQNKFYNDILL